MHQGQIGPADPGCLYLDQTEATLGNSLQHRPHPGRALRMMGTGVMGCRRGMARNNDLHPRTLACVATRLHFEGDWPEPVIIKRGWSKASARRWNEDVPDVAIRLERGSSEFLKSATEAMRDLAQADVFSPALYPDTTRVWHAAGYQPHAELDIMERSITRQDLAESPDHGSSLIATTSPRWGEVVEVDRRAFEGFWRMGADGLVEAMVATPSAVFFEWRIQGELAGYALTGTQLTTSFLQRVAVSGDEAGHGIGTELIRACLRWAASKGAQRMVLNVRPENVGAKSLYARLGFSDTGKSLHVLKFDG